MLIKHKNPSHNLAKVFTIICNPCTTNITMMQITYEIQMKQGSKEANSQVQGFLSCNQPRVAPNIQHNTQIQQAIDCQLCC